MGSINQNLLPATAGLNLGSPVQVWNVFAGTLSAANNSIDLGTTSGAIIVAPTSLVNLVSIVLSGNVTGHTFDGSGLPAGSLVIYKITQNSTGGYSFVWPASAVGAQTVGNVASQATYQSFFWDGTNLIATTTAILNPTPADIRSTYLASLINTTTLAATNVASSAVTVKNLQGTLFADQFPGADIGAQINAAIAALPVVGGYPTGKIIIPAGNYSMSTTVTINSPSVWIEGAGSGATVITYTGNSDAFNTKLSPAVIAPGFTLGGLQILGTGSSNADAVGLHCGDMVGGKFYDLQIDNFLGTNSAGIWIDNTLFWFERNLFENIEVGIHGPGTAQSGCTKGIKQTYSGPGTASFSYNTFIGLRLSVAANTKGLSIESGALSASFIEGNANIGDNATLFYISTTIGGNANFINFAVDSGSSAGWAVWNVPASGVFNYKGGIEIAAINPPTDTLAGSLNHSWPTGYLTLQDATPTGAGTDVSLGISIGFGNGTTSQAVVTTLKGTGSGPTTATTVVNHLEIDIGGTKYWIPLMQ